MTSGIAGFSSPSTTLKAIKSGAKALRQSLTEFQNSVEDCLRASAPLLIVLRAVDGDEKPAMLEVTALMNHAKDRIKLSFNISTKQGLLKRIMDVIEKRWVNQMEHPLYGAALYLNPGKFYPLVKANDDATVG